ncbi:FAD-binding and (Fe-S)-binding domain-containing protein [Saccharopolyspora griseoalba]|uniref:FAD-binding and (Fe-S)-binding domain-containing protein n=1 Tax=Saccharopolyspora griseoalba TaxID=1431848 RepID=A0ABW2LEU5_9PSEU
MRQVDTALAEELRRHLDGNVRFDDYTRHLYATDASMYQVRPVGVVFPRHAGDVETTARLCREAGAALLPRGAGTSHCGQAVGEAVVLDFSKHMNRLLELDPDRMLARVQPGLVQDELNLAAGEHGLFFAPDTSTSNRATLGGMIGNNSCGSRSARYGMTIDHVEELEVVLSDGSRARLRELSPAELAEKAAGSGLEGEICRELPRIVDSARPGLAQQSQQFWRRAGGYRLDRLAEGPFDLAKFLVGSEGTLATVTEALVRLTPRPKATAMVVGHFDSTAACIAATDTAMRTGAAGIEMVDDFILGLARSSPQHGHLFGALHGDPKALMFAEFYGETAEEARAGAQALAAAWRAEGHGYASALAATEAELAPLRALRKSGLGLLMAAGRPAERSIAFVEDTAVPPEHLAEYTARFAEILDSHGLRAGFYGHASAGCLHVRPFLDLTRPDQVSTMRRVAEEVCELALSYGGVNSSEHGDGYARSEFNRRIFGDTVYEAMREVKALFDPERRMNPGKVVDAPPMTDNLREPTLPVPTPIDTHFDFGRHGGMRGEAERCQRIGACRKPPTSGAAMCPSFMATRDEEHSTRGRANALVLALSQPDPAAALGGDRLNEVLDLCLECKACAHECPMSVDMATLKSEALAHHHERHGVDLRSRLFGATRRLYRLGALAAPLTNRLAAPRPLRALLQRITGIDRRRPLPTFRRDHLLRWNSTRPATPVAPGVEPGERGEVVFLADSFTSHTEPEIGRAAIRLLEHAGWRVRVESEVCCARPQISKGLLPEAERTASALVRRLAPEAERGARIAGCEPSCVSALRDEHPRLLGDGRTEAIADRAALVDELLLEALEDGTLTPASGPARIAFHGHCHQKAVLGTGSSAGLLRHLAEVDELDAGCCGMAGSFGFEAEHYELSMRIGAQRLFPAIESAPDSTVAATGVSCRQQVAHGTGRRAHHPVELLHDAVFGARSDPTLRRGAFR